MDEQYLPGRGPTVAMRGLLVVAHVGLIALAAQAAAPRALPAGVRRQAGRPGAGLEAQDAERLGNLRKGRCGDGENVGKTKKNKTGGIV